MERNMLHRSGTRAQLRVGLSLMALLLTTGCAMTGGPSEGSQRAQLDVQCQDPRPEVCTFEYQPVCALRESDQSAGREWETYSNGCTACSDVTVIGYKAEPCDQSSH